MVMRKLAIIGGSGHARVAADAATLGGFTPGFVLEDGSPVGSIDGYPVLGTDQHLPNLASASMIVVAIGDNGRVQR